MIFAFLCGICSILFVSFMSLPIAPQLIGSATCHIKTKEKVVALTFDDGPDAIATPQILAALKKHDIKATFFVVGSKVQKYPELVKQAFRQGYEIGNHTWSHTTCVLKSKSTIRKHIQNTDDEIRKTGYTGTIHFRAPHGMKLINLPLVLKKMGKEHILFDVWAWDWNAPGTDRIVSYAMTGAKPGSIILLHDGCGNPEQTVPAVDTIITKLKEQGYRFVTVSELLALRGKKQK